MAIGPLKAMISSQSRPMLVQDANIITYREQSLPLLLRLFIGVLSLAIGLLLPLTWIINVNGQTSVPVLMLVASVTLLSVVFGAFLARVALVSATELHIDPSAPHVIRTRRGPWLNDVSQLPRRSFAPPELIMRDSEDGPYPILRLRHSGRKLLDIACFDGPSEAEAWRKAIVRALAA